MNEARKLGSNDPDFLSLINKVSVIVQRISGNRLGDKQSFMIETRLKKRMMELGFKSPFEYESYLKQHEKEESMVLVGLITTHYTYFFREFIHFEILKNELPRLAKEVLKREDKTLKIWSAACSKGHEVYSLGMFLSYHLPLIDKSLKFKILGTDIDVDSVKVAQNGVYGQNEIKEIPMVYLNNNWAHGTGDIAQFAKVKSIIKNNCEFRAGNLLDVEGTVGREKFDVVFCRNVFIYFDAEKVKSISMKIMEKIQPHGIYFSGVSEPLTHFKLDLFGLGPSAYTLLDMTTSAAPVAAPRAVVEEKRILRVMCVDDSSTILTLLKKILTPEFGFEVVATAINGRDAMEKLKLQPVDLMTLDIHMPEMDGISYLEKNFTGSHPPVMMISSASREDSDTAMKALRLGAVDYVEKPGLSNIEERGEEIRNKLKIMSSLKTAKTQVSSFDLENQTKYEIKDTHNKMRLMFGSISHMESFKTFFKEARGIQPATVIFIDGAGDIIEKFSEENKYKFSLPVAFLTSETAKLEDNHIYFVNTKDDMSWFTQKYKYSRASVLSYGNMTKKYADFVSMWTEKDIILEDFGSDVSLHPLRFKASDIVPATSFCYLSMKFLSK